MKTTLLNLFVLGLWLSSNAQEKASYNYFIPEYKVPDLDSRIDINKKGDTVLVSRFQIQNSTANTHQIIEKIYKNTPYFKNGWYKGEIITDHDNALNFVIAYNIQQATVYLVYDKNEPAKVMHPLQFTIQNHTFKQFKKRYYETIYTGKNEILKEHQCMLQLSKSLQKIGYGPEEKEYEFEGEFVKSAKYYLKNGNALKSIPMSNRGFKLLGAQRKTVEVYAKERALNPKREADLIAIFKYFDTLQ